jgi:CHRD domain
MSQKQTLLVVVLAAVISVGTFSTILNSLKVQAQEGQTFTANLSGEEEGPLNNSTASGSAKFVVHSNGSEVSYAVNLTGLKSLSNLDLVVGNNASEGPGVLRIAEDEKAENESSPVITLNGNITADDLTGAFEGKNMSDLIALLGNGSAYLEADTPIYPKGAIEGKFTSGSAMVETSPSTDMSAGMNNTAVESNMPSTSEENDQSAQMTGNNATQGSMTNATSNAG